jgi:hypothetical protein
MCFEQIFCLGIALATLLAVVARDRMGWLPRHPAGWIVALIPISSIIVMALWAVNPVWTKANLPFYFNSPPRAESLTHDGLEQSPRKKQNLFEILSGDIKEHELEFSLAASLLPFGSLMATALLGDLRKRKLTISYEDRESEVVTPQDDPYRFWLEIALRMVIVVGFLSVGLFSTTRLLAPTF